jgi:hypothetical protein
MLFLVPVLGIGATWSAEPTRAARDLGTLRLALARELGLGRLGRTDRSLAT